VPRKLEQAEPANLIAHDRADVGLDDVSSRYGGASLPERVRRPHQRRPERGADDRPAARDVRFGSWVLVALWILPSLVALHAAS
jgi:hypothetical protein